MGLITTNGVSRRSFIRTATSSVIGIPFLSSTVQGATTQAAAPKRMIFMSAGYGFTKQSFYPRSEGQLSKMELPAGLQPLQDHIKDFTIVSNLTNVAMKNPHAGSLLYLSAAVNKVSCDQVAASNIGASTRFPSLSLGGIETMGQARSGHHTPSLSQNTYGKPMSAIKKPLDLYHQLFTNNMTEKKAFEEALRKKKSMLDVLSISASDMSSKLNAVDKDKLDEYFQGVREIELALKRQADWADKPKPKAPLEAIAVEEYAAGKEETKMVFDMLVTALQADMTRVASYLLPMSTLLPSIGVDVNIHTLSHYGVYKKFREASELRDKVSMELLAHFVTRLKQAKDVDGSRLFDNCIVSYGCNLRSGHELRNLPALLTGGGAKNIKSDQHIILKKRDTHLARYWLTLLNEAGCNVNSFNGQNEIIKELM